MSTHCVIGIYGFSLASCPVIPNCRLQTHAASFYQRGLREWGRNNRDGENYMERGGCMGTKKIHGVGVGMASIYVTNVTVFLTATISGRYTFH